MIPRKENSCRVSTRTSRRAKGRPHRLRYKWAALIAALVAGIVAPGFGAEPEFSDEEILERSSVRLPLDQIGRYAVDADPASIKWGRFAVFDPATAKILRDRRNTQEQLEAEDRAMLAISDPEAYRQAQRQSGRGGALGTPAEQALERRNAQEREDAFRAMGDPAKSAREAKERQSAAERRRDAIARQAILTPREFNTRVQAHKSLALRQKEADAILAFSQPRLFWEQRVRENKTGVRERDKERSPGQAVSEPPAGKSPASRPETGAVQGGGR